jgi:hypothetical protein
MWGNAEVAEAAPVVLDERAVQTVFGVFMPKA